MHEIQVLKLSKSMFDIVKQCVWGGQTWCLGVSGIAFCMAKKTKQARQRYSLTILTVIADLRINTILHFQRLFRFYFESFSLSKNFIIFRLKRKFRWVWHGFCCMKKSTYFSCKTTQKNKLYAALRKVIASSMQLQFPRCSLSAWQARMCCE